jgi:hypothetical protein
MNEFKSHRSFLDFAVEVSRSWRYRLPPAHREFLETLLATSATRVETIPAGTIFFRAQSGHDWRPEGEGEASFDVEWAFSEERMKPLPFRAVEGRANPKGIPCLYVATSIATAVGECRPWVGALVSVSQVRTSRELRIVNCTSDEKGGRIYFQEPSPEERERKVWKDIDRAFAEPVTRADDTAEYAATQIVAELFRENGLDGLGYRSALGSGHNLALFDIGCADVINGQLIRVDRLELEYSQADNPYVVSRFYNKDTE